MPDSGQAAAAAAAAERVRATKMHGAVWTAVSILKRKSKTLK